MNQKLPNATGVLILGIVSLVTCCCYGIVGLIAAIIGLVLANKDMALYNQNPGQYDNYSNLKTGRILCIIGIVLNILSVIYYIYIISAIGTDALLNPELLQERLRDMQGQ
ncbi:CCC motif membrane protein [Chryseobacterium sp. JJR-5R]|uniref:CCC motif membrane protein n=1 Tax=Chryseobacterium sp. JJR-5R TaxID=3093923 RepID=UPI002A7669C3|nr:CCC motif membrane protein [Chryseobacterium sp. JJR-5R]WPO81862.1 CCC motif membrane protein [Chryseobacterium sp. JJR-5R]